VYHGAGYAGGGSSPPVRIWQMDINSTCVRPWIQWIQGIPLLQYYSFREHLSQDGCFSFDNFRGRIKEKRGGVSDEQ